MPPLSGLMHAIIRMVEVLPGAVRTEEAERLAPGDGEVDPVDRNEVAEALDQAVGLDHGLALPPGGVGRVARVVGSRIGDAVDRQGM